MRKYLPAGRIVDKFHARLLARCATLRPSARRGYVTVEAPRQPDLFARLATGAPSRPQDATTPTSKRIATGPRAQTRAKRHADLESPWLVDPLELSNRVRSLVTKDFDKALELTKNASSKMQCVVSYNCLIQDCLKRGAVTQAFSLYNDMKKRRQFPDQYTITIMLTGLRMQTTRTPNNLARALDVYRSLSATNSRVKCDVIHTNAILALCAAHNDMSAMWSIVATIPDTGAASANSITYSTLLKAIRDEHFSGARLHDHNPTQPTEEEQQLRTAAVEDGKRIWADVVAKWRHGRLSMDEALVTQMGLLLQIGARQEDFNDVLRLAHQTIGLPQVVSPPTLPSTDLHSQEENEPDDAEVDVFKPLVLAAESAPALRPTDTHRSRSTKLVRPGPATLSIVMTADLHLRAWKAAHEHWRYMTEDLKVSPDRDNYNSYLRVLRVSRSSARTLELIKQAIASSNKPHDLPPVNSSTYIIAMSACARDSNNPNMVETAVSIIDLMLQNEQSVPDTDRHRGRQRGSPAQPRFDAKTVSVLEKYLELCIQFGKAHQIRNAYEQLIPLFDSGHAHLWSGGGSEHKQKLSAMLRQRAGQLSRDDDSDHWKHIMHRLNGSTKSRTKKM